MAENLLEVESVSAAYGNIRALQDVSLKVPQGAIVALLGANGAGKSTTLNVISRLVTPTAGSVRFAGEASAAPEREAALSNLLNIIGRRNGARSIITVG